MEKKLNVIVHSRDGDIFKGEALRVSSSNGKGKFDILPGHANFISLINDDLEIEQLPGNVMRIPIDSALLRNKADFVEVYTGIDNEPYGQVR